MAVNKRNQILIYERIETPKQPHQILLRDPRFIATGVVRNGWRSFSNEWTYSSGLGYAEYTDAGAHAPLYQNFTNALLPETYYNIEFELSNVTAGKLKVKMGGDEVITLSANGSYSVVYYSSSGNTTATMISFVPEDIGGNYFRGRLTDVYIRQNEVYSEVEKDLRYEPKGFLDLSENERVGATYQVNDVRQINRRFGGYTKTFKLPGSDNNKQLLGNLQLDGAAFNVFDPRNKTKAQFLNEDGIVIDGWLSLKSISNDGDNTSFEIEMYDNSFGLLDTIRGKKVSDLNLDRYDHRLTLDNIVDTWSGGTWTDGYFYPLYLFLGDTFEVDKDFRPAYYMRMLLDEIFIGAGYSYELSPALETALDPMLIAPVGKKPQADISDIEQYRLIAGSSASQVFTSDHRHYTQDPPPPLQLYYQTDWTANAETLDEMGTYDTTTYRFRPKFSGKYNIDIKVIADIVLTTNGVATVNDLFDLGVEQQFPNYIQFDFYDVSNGASVYNTNQWKASQDTTHVSQTISAYEFRINETGVELEAGKEYGVRISVSNTALFKTEFFSPVGFVYSGFKQDIEVDDASSYINIVPSEGQELREGMLVRAEKFLKNVTQEQVINDLIKAFNLYFIPDRENSRKVRIYSYPEIYGTGLVLDRSGRCNLDDVISKQSLSEVSTSIIDFGCKNAINSDVFNARYKGVASGVQYGDKRFSFGTDLFNDITEVRFGLATPAPITRDWYGRYVPAVLSRSEDTDTKYLLTCNETYDTSIDIKYYDERSATTITAITHYCPATHVNNPTASTQDINFGEVQYALTDTQMTYTSNNLYNTYYLDQLVQYRDSMLYTVYMRLSNQDVREHLDNIGARIWIPELNNYFTLYSIIDFDPTQGENSMTKVQLLEAGIDERITPRVWQVVANPTSSSENPIAAGEIPGDTRILIEGGLSINVGPTNTVIGPNTVYGGTYNTVTGVNNVVGGNTTNNTIFGNNNVINAGVSGSTILGGTNITATTSNTTYINNQASFGPSGATFYNSTYISTTGITTNSITIGGQVITSIPAGMDFEYTFDDTVDGVPATGTTTLDYWEYNGAGKINISNLTSNGVDISTPLLAMRSGFNIYVQRTDDNTSSALYSVSSVVNNGTYVTVNISSWLGGGDTVNIPSAGDKVYFRMINHTPDVKVNNFTFNGVNGFRIWQTDGSTYDATIPNLSLSGGTFFASNIQGTTIVGGSVQATSTITGPTLSLTSSANTPDRSVLFRNPTDGVVTGRTDFYFSAQTVNVPYAQMTALDLIPQAVVPTAKMGRVFFSGDGFMYLFTGNTSSDCKRVSIV